MLTVSATATTALAGFVFNVLLIARAPLQLFQAIQTSLLPHLTGLEATEGHDEFARAIRVTILAIAAFAGAVALGLLLIGPWAMDVVFGEGYDYGRVGLAVVAIGMGFHLAAGTLNQAALARGHARAAAGAWLIAAALFVVWMVLPIVGDRARARRGRLRRRGGAPVRDAGRAVSRVALHQRAAHGAKARAVRPSPTSPGPCTSTGCACAMTPRSSARASSTRPWPRSAPPRSAVSG